MQINTENFQVQSLSPTIWTSPVVLVPCSSHNTFKKEGTTVKFLTPKIGNWNTELATYTGKILKPE